MATAWGDAAYVKASVVNMLSITVPDVYTGMLALGPGGVIIDATPPLHGAAAAWRTVANAKAATEGVTDAGYTSI